MNERTNKRTNERTNKHKHAFISSQISSTAFGSSTHYLNNTLKTCYTSQCVFYNKEIT